MDWLSTSFPLIPSRSIYFSKAVWSVNIGIPRKGSFFLHHFLGRDQDKGGRITEHYTDVFWKLRIQSWPVLGMMRFSFTKSTPQASLDDTSSRGQYSWKGAVRNSSLALVKLIKVPCPSRTWPFETKGRCELGMTENKVKLEVLEQNTLFCE